DQQLTAGHLAVVIAVEMDDVSLLDDRIVVGAGGFLSEPGGSIAPVAATFAITGDLGGGGAVEDEKQYGEREGARGSLHGDSVPPSRKPSSESFCGSLIGRMLRPSISSTPAGLRNQTTSWPSWAAGALNLKPSLRHWPCVRSRYRGGPLGMCSSL